MTADRDTSKAGEDARLGCAFFARPTLQVARQLLGRTLVRQPDGGARVEAVITETEAYRAPRDAASHAWRGRRTARVEPLYGAPGTYYVYLIYGLHWMLNVATVARDVPEGVLIRAALVDGADGTRRLLDGPGRVARALSIDRSLDGTQASTSDALWFEDRGPAVPRRAIRALPRIGVDYAGPYWASRPWRFRVDDVWLSRRFELRRSRTPASAR